ncbi:MAG: tol-pal system YbgF family protein [Kofleriaceae bacterium]
MTRPLIRIITIVVTLLFASSAFGDPAERAAKRHFDRGQKLFNLGKFEEALDEYTQAYEAKPIPDFLFNIGQCHRNLNNFDAAIFSFKKYLKLAPEAENRDQVEEYIADLEAEQEKENSRRLRLVKEQPPPPPPEGKPVYKKWWFWTGLALVGAGAGVGIYAATRPGETSSPPMTTGGNINFPP